MTWSSNMPGSFNPPTCTHGGRGCSVQYTPSCPGTHRITGTGANATGMISLTVTGSGCIGGAPSTPNKFTPSVTSVAPNSGPAGTFTRITGTGFNGTRQVLFGGVSASFVVDGFTQISAQAPAGGSGSVDVRVANSVGTSATNSADIFTYTTDAFGPTPGGPGSDTGPGAGRALTCVRVPTLLRHTLRGARKLLEIDNCIGPLDYTGRAREDGTPVRITTQNPAPGTPLFTGDRIAVTVR